ncbi:MAG: MFS transporter [Promethearchaeota archaeon]
MEEKNEKRLSFPQLNTSDPFSYKITFKQQLAYGLAASAVSLLLMTFNTWLPSYYTDIIKVSLTHYGIAFIIFMFWNAINDPLFGYIMDKTKTKWGRRVPYIIISAPILTGTFIMLWTPPIPSSTEEDLWTIIYFIIVLFLFDTSLTLVSIAKSSYFPQISMEEGERTKLAFISTIISVPAMAIALVVPYFFKGNAHLFKIFMSCVSVFSLFAWLYLAKTMKENKVFIEVDEPMKFLDALKYTFKNKSFVIFLAYNFLLQTTIGLITPGIVYVINYILKGTGTVPILIIGLSGLAGLIYGIRIPVIYGKKDGVRTPLFVTAISLTVAGFLYTFSDNFVVAVISYFLLGLSFPSAYILYDVAISEIIDEDEMRTRIRREGTYYGINNFTIKPCISLGIFILTTILDKYGFQPNIPATPDVVFGIKLATFGIPGILMGIGSIIILLFPIHGDYLRKIKKEIAKLHKEKQQIAREKHII